MASHTQLIYEFDDFQLEPDERKLLRHGQVIPLHGKAFEMLLVLIRNRGRLLTKDELFHLVWPDQIVEESNLTVNMSAIRRALGERASRPRYITTVSGLGYRFNAEVRQFAAEALTIERDTFARVTVEQEEIESRFGLALRMSGAVRRLTSHPVLLGVTCAIVLAIAGIGIWVKVMHRTSAAPLPWSHVTINRFATHGGVPFRVAISPDGKSLVYDQSLKGTRSLWLGQIESNSSVEILKQPDILYHGLTFAPDDQNLYFTEFDSSKLFRMPVVGGVPTLLLQNVHSAVSFSPDGRRLAFLRRVSGGTAIVIGDSVDGRNERTLVVRKLPDNFSSSGLSWSPDGKQIAVAAKNVATSRVELQAISLFDGSARKISDRSWGEIGNVKWQPDGAGVIFIAKSSALARRSEIWFAPYPEGEPRKITNDVKQYLLPNLSVSANGIVAVIEGISESEIWVAPDGDVTRAHRVLQGVEPKYEGVDGLAWTPDGHLLYTAYVGDAMSIWEMDGEGSNRRQLTNNVSDLVDQQMSVTADNRFMVFQSNRSGSMQIWRANRDGSNLRQLTTAGTNTQPSLSRDSKWIIYVSDSSGESTLWRMSIEGGEMTQLTHERSWNPRVSADGKYIAYLVSSPFRLAIMPFTGGKVEKTFALPDRPGPNLARRMCWTPDGKAILYRDTMEGFWRQRLDEAKPQFVAGSDGTPTTQLTWSFNGKGLAYTRKSDMQQILLLQNAR
ncbi:MAG TPA: winged helix-turn-helix domain-containing protein [Pyrinomonadaceae bacterium]|nr:winged helix-turn-helix domain-containing protein [Pyrinomonadaceae bacterium]